MKIRTSRKPPRDVFWGVVSSPVGNLVVGTTADAEICRVSFLQKDAPQKKVREWRKKWPSTSFHERHGADADIRNHADKPFLLVGTPFQCAVWRTLTLIPFGQTWTYGDVARRMGKPKAVRAIGGACGANPVPFFIPCHRVVAASGLGGFSAGLDVKKQLLKTEGFRNF